MFQGCSAVFHGVLRCSGGVPGMFRSVPGFTDTRELLVYVSDNPINIHYFE